MDAQTLERVESRMSAVLKAEAAAEPEKKTPDKPEPEIIKSKTAAKPEPEEVEEEPEPEAAAEPEPEADPEETNARSAGWVPKEEWKGDPNLWVPAKAFNKNGALYDSVKSLKRKTDDQEALLKSVLENNKKMAEALRKQRVEEKMAERDAAIETGDKAKVRKLDEDIAKIGEELKPEPKVEAKPEAPPEIKEFVDKHPWLNAKSDDFDPAAAHAAFDYFARLEKKSPEAVADNLTKTRDYIKRRFPDLFPEGVKKEPEKIVRKLSSVEAPTTRADSGAKKFNYSHLNADQKRVCDMLVRRGEMTREQYIQQLADIGEIS